MAKGNGEGTIVKRKDGRFEARITYGRTPEGKLARRSVYGKTRREVAQKLTELLEQQRKGGRVAPAKLTFATFLPQWLERKEAHVKPSTWVGYSNIVHRHLLPHIGEEKVQELSVEGVETLYARLRAKGLAPRMVQLVHVVLSNAMKQALAYDLVFRNVMERVTPPKAPPYRAKVWDAGQVRTFVARSQEHHWHDLYILALLTGMRRGELLGLQWEDIDWTNGRLTVARNLTLAGRQVVMSTPKTERGYRTLYLSTDALALLNERRRKQEEQRQKAKDRWVETGHVFTTATGRWIPPVKVSQEFYRLSGELGLPQIRLHDTRHTNASLLARQGVPLKVLSERLGHATPAFTAKTYQHLYDDQHRAAALSLEVLTANPGDET